MRPPAGGRIITHIRRERIQQTIKKVSCTTVVMVVLRSQQAVIVGKKRTTPFFKETGGNIKKVRVLLTHCCKTT